MDENVRIPIPTIEPPPKPSWSFSPVRLDVTPEMVKLYFEDSPNAVGYLIDELLTEYPWVLEHVIDDHKEEFVNFLCATIAESV